MTWRVTSAALKSRLLATAFRAFARKSLTANAAISGPATPTAPQAKLDALRLLEIQIAQLNRLHRNDPRRAKLRKAIYSARHDILRGRTCA